jgi:hypothetical protein
MGERRELHTGFWWETQKRPLEGRKRRSRDNIKIELKGRGWDGMVWIGVAQDRYQWRPFVNTVMNLRLNKMGEIL